MRLSGSSATHGRLGSIYANRFKPHMAQIAIRPITAIDFEGFHRCLDAVARERKYLALVSAPPLEQTRRWLADSLAQDAIRLVAVDEARIVGWCDIDIRAWEGFSHSGRLGMGVLSAYRGQGVGSALLEKTLAIAKERHLERLELEVYASNVPAIRLYEKFHFQTEGRKKQARKIDGVYDDLVQMALLVD